MSKEKQQLPTQGELEEAMKLAVQFRPFLTNTPASIKDVNLTIEDMGMAIGKLVHKEVSKLKGGKEWMLISSGYKDYFKIEEKETGEQIMYMNTDDLKFDNMKSSLENVVHKHNKESKEERCAINNTYRKGVK